MTQGVEREPFYPKPPFYLYTFRLPDGLDCEWTFTKDEVLFEQLLECARDLANQVHLTGREHRLAYDGDSINSVAEILAKERTGLSVQWGRTSFFEVSLKVDRQILSLTDIDIYRENYTVQRVDDLEGFESLVFSSLMVGSFGEVYKDGEFIPDKQKVAAISSHFKGAVRDISNYCYLVKGLAPNPRYLGGFVLKYLPALSEVQLHSVAGRGSSALGVVQRPHKLPLLMAAVFEALQHDFPQEQDYGVTSASTLQYSGVERLTFSSSGVAPLYEALGFQKSSRSGLVIKPAA